MSTLVLNLDDLLVSRLSAAAARSRKALPDWAAEQLSHLANPSAASLGEAYSLEWQATSGSISEASLDSPARDEMRAALGSLTGIWKDRGTTDELMHLTRGED